MAFTNNEKQIRHKRLEELKKYGNEVFFRWSLHYDPFSSGKDRDEVSETIKNAVNLRHGWNEDDFKRAKMTIDSVLLSSMDNNHLLDNDIVSSRNITSREDIAEMQSAKNKSAKAVKSMRLMFSLADIDSSDGNAICAEMMRQHANDLIAQRDVQKSFANAIAMALLGSNYKLPDWTWNLLARYLMSRNDENAIAMFVKELNDPANRERPLIING